MTMQAVVLSTLNTDLRQPHLLFWCIWPHHAQLSQSLKQFIPAILLPFQILHDYQDAQPSLRSQSSAVPTYSYFI